MQIKRVIYIALFILFGVLVQFLIHAGVEIGYIQLLISHYGIFGFGLPFDSWFIVHTVLSTVSLILGVVAGYYLGVFWWKRLYENK